MQRRLTTPMQRRLTTPMHADRRELIGYGRGYLRWVMGTVRRSVATTPSVENTFTMPVDPEPRRSTNRYHRLCCMNQEKAKQPLLEV